MLRPDVVVDVVVSWSWSNKLPTSTLNYYTGKYILPFSHLITIHRYMAECRIPGTYHCRVGT